MKSRIALYILAIVSLLLAGCRHADPPMLRLNPDFNDLLKADHVSKVSIIHKPLGSILVYVQLKPDAPTNVAHNFMLQIDDDKGLQKDLIAHGVNFTIGRR